MSTTISGTNGVTFPDSTSMQTGQQACKAWVNFNGTGTVAIRGGYNVASITDIGVGNYLVSFTTALVDANYSVSGTTSVDASTATAALAVTTGSPVVESWRGFTTTECGINTYSSVAGWVDPRVVSVSIFR